MNEHEPVEHVDSDDVDDIIHIASLLQDRADRRVSIDDVEKIAIELDISPEKVKEALLFLDQQRAEERARALGIARADQRKRALTIGLIVGFFVIIFGVTFLQTRSSSHHLTKLQQAVLEHETQLSAVIDRQASLLPQLLSMMGAEDPLLKSQQQRVLEETKVEGKLVLSRALNQQMTTAIAKLPQTQNAADHQAQLNFQYEVIGAQNRISTEQKRYNFARREWELASRGYGARLALAIGWAERLH